MHGANAPCCLTPMLFAAKPARLHATHSKSIFYEATKIAAGAIIS
jgi:hypothetical protein